MAEESIHNIRLYFKCPKLWSILSSYHDSESFIESINEKSNKDIRLCTLDLKDFIIKPTVHRTDSVTVAVACSQSPISMNLEGLARLTSGLTRLEERLQRVRDEHLKLNLNNNNTTSSIILSPIHCTKLHVMDRYHVALWP